MNFYEFNQNNSGGSFEVDDKLCHRLIIEAKNYEEAENIAFSLGVEFNTGCSCCGDRWHAGDKVELEKYKKEGYPVSVYCSLNPDNKKEWLKKYGNYKRKSEPRIKDKNTSYQSLLGKIIFKNIEEYAQYEANEWGWTTPDVRIFYKNGKIKEIFTIKC